MDVLLHHRHPVSCLYRWWCIKRDLIDPTLVTPAYQLQGIVINMCTLPCLASYHYHLVDDTDHSSIPSRITRETHEFKSTRYSTKYISREPQKANKAINPAIHADPSAQPRLGFCGVLEATSYILLGLFTFDCNSRAGLMMYSRTLFPFVFVYPVPRTSSKTPVEWLVILGIWSWYHFGAMMTNASQLTLS